jgi:hypothetical protein
MIGPFFRSGTASSNSTNLLEEGEDKGDQKLTSFQATSLTAIDFGTNDDFEAGDLCLVWVEANNAGGATARTLQFYRDEDGDDLLWESPPLKEASDGANDAYWHAQLLVPTSEYDAVWVKWSGAPDGSANLWFQTIIHLPVA